MLTRIFTENTDRSAIENIVAAHFESFTTYEAQGFWKGKPENSLVIEIESQFPADVDQMATEIRDSQKQASVLIERFQTQSYLI